MTTWRARSPRPPARPSSAPDTTMVIGIVLVVVSVVAFAVGLIFAKAALVFASIGSAVLAKVVLEVGRRRSDPEDEEFDVAMPPYRGTNSQAAIGAWSGPPRSLALGSMAGERLPDDDDTHWRFDEVLDDEHAEVASSLAPPAAQVAPAERPEFRPLPPAPPQPPPGYGQPQAPPVYGPRPPAPMYAPPPAAAAAPTRFAPPPVVAGDPRVVPVTSAPPPQPARPPAPAPPPPPQQAEVLGDQIDRSLDRFGEHLVESLNQLFDEYVGEALGELQREVAAERQDLNDLRTQLKAVVKGGIKREETAKDAIDDLRGELDEIRGQLEALAGTQEGAANDELSRLAEEMRALRKRVALGGNRRTGPLQHEQVQAIADAVAAAVLDAVEIERE